LLGGGPGDIPIIHTLYDTYVFWCELLIKFPKTQRYTLGDRVSAYMLDTIELLITAASSSDTELKQDCLRVASAKTDIMKLLIRSAKDSKSINNDQYLKLQSKLNEIGKMLGGWLKHIEKQSSL